MSAMDVWPILDHVFVCEDSQVSKSELILWRIKSTRLADIPTKASLQME